MGLQRLERPTYTFAKGIITDAPVLQFPEDASVDEQNFELLLDGSRRRRRGAALESSGSTLSLSTNTDSAVRSFKWHNVNGDPTLDLVVIQIGSTLHFYTDTTVISSNKLSFTIDLTARAITGTAAATVRVNPVDMAAGRGQLFVVGKYIEPFYVYKSGSSYVVESITIRERDFDGVGSTTATTEMPSALSAQHQYNLKNSGWTSTDIDAFYTDQSVYPSLNMVSWMGYRRAVNTGYAESDGIKEFSSDKLIAEVFGDAPAPAGHFLRDPFNTADVLDQDVTTTYIASNAIPALNGLTSVSTTITLNFSANHGLSVADEVRWGTTFVYYVTSGGAGAVWDLTDSIMTVSVVDDPDTATFTISVPSDFSPGSLAYSTTYLYSVGEENPTGYTSPYRPTCTAFYAGRVWYAGTPYDSLHAKLFFSQIIEAEAQYGKCYQQADPTDPNISDLVDTDGGVLNIPEIESVRRLKVHGPYLLVFASNGIWQIGPGSAGYFTATSYSVRKISALGCVNGDSVVIAEDMPTYWGTDSIYSIVQDPNSGYLVVQNISAGKIDTFYSAIPVASKEEACQATYDPVNKRILWFYNSSGSTRQRLNTVLVYDARFGAFTKWVFSESAASYIASAFTLKDNTGTETNRIKLVGLTGTNTTLSIGEIRLTTAYTDWGLTEQDAYLVTGYDTAQAVSKRKYAPTITVFMKRTETGFTDLGSGDYTPIGESSLTMQARWDWTDNTVAGKWGTAQQVYRHQRLFTPSTTASYEDGYPIVVTKNKIRGRGRSIHLKFTAGSGKTAHLIGWTTNYSVLTDE